MDSLGLTSESNWHQLCSKHFDINCIKNINGYKRKLWHTAVPSSCTAQFEVVHQICSLGIYVNPETNISSCTTQFEVVHQICTPGATNVEELIENN
ncbi:unnamed protein product [Macrosiphum euphorbiae]|uniref:THAP-type domain-containing protein n=1 Tax=Macrosiphum euphorbiae TaxID=13131 RepID=A0AAV0XIB7_9HEMI|nr:unnamed protein product [Macrosiphum euphorbiae]